jgi:hypothetical protein
MKLHIIITYDDASQEIFHLFYIPANYTTNDGTLASDDNLDETQFLNDMFLIMKTPEKLDTLSVAKFCWDGSRMLKAGPFNEGKWWFNIEYNNNNDMVFQYKTMLNKWLETKDSNKPYGKSLKYE